MDALFVLNSEDTSDIVIQVLLHQYRFDLFGSAAVKQCCQVIANIFPDVTDPACIPMGFEAGTSICIEERLAKSTDVSVS